VVNKIINKIAFLADDIIRDVPLVEQHCHTDFTDGNNSVQEMIQSAIDKGLNRIVITEHVQSGSPWTSKFINEVESLKLKFSDQINIEYGFEAKLINYDGEIDIKSSLLRSAPLILGAVHGYVIDGESCKFHDFDDITTDEALELEIRGIEALTKNKYVDIIAHPLGVFERRFGPAPLNAYGRVIELIKKSDKVFEINSKYHRRPADLLRLCAKHQIKVSFGSDAHDIERVGYACRIMGVRK